MGWQKGGNMKVTSKKHAGVYYNELSNGDKAYFVRFNVDGKRYDPKKEILNFKKLLIIDY